MSNIVVNAERKLAILHRRKRLKKLQKKYNFNDWHLIPIISKPYVKDIVKYIEKNFLYSGEGYVVEFGCGLCDIIGDYKLRKYKRIGVDLSEEVCNAARELHNEVTIINGTFDEIENVKIECLIAVNFIHNISSDDMSLIIGKLTAKNQVRCIIVDEVTGNYPFTHNFDKIMPEIYFCKKILSPYSSDGGERYIKIYEMKNGK